APGEAEAELAQMNRHSEIDGIITEDSDVFVFGAQCVFALRGSLPSVQNMSLIYTLQSIETTDNVSLDTDGLFLCALLLGGDYDPIGIKGVGPAIARALAAAGFGRDLVNILRSSKGPECAQHLAMWRNALREELRSNSSGRLDRCQPKLAMDIPDTFPALDIASLYLDPLTSRSPGFVGHIPNPTLWQPKEPSLVEMAAFCAVQFGWNGDFLLKKLHNNVWPGVAFRLISSVRADISIFHFVNKLLALYSLQFGL
ncbi:hypothetical protein B0H17DRAFT_968356, partial [Mycena rosella]